MNSFAAAVKKVLFLLFNRKTQNTSEEVLYADYFAVYPKHHRVSPCYLFMEVTAISSEETEKLRQSTFIITSEYSNHVKHIKTFLELIALAQNDLESLYEKLVLGKCFNCAGHSAETLLKYLIRESGSYDFDLDRMQLRVEVRKHHSPDGLDEYSPQHDPEKQFLLQH